MQIFLSVIVFASSLALIGSVVLQEGRDAGMSGAVGGASEKLFGKGSAKGIQAVLQRITVVSAVLFMISIFIMSALF